MLSNTSYIYKHTTSPSLYNSKGSKKSYFLTLFFANLHSKTSSLYRPHQLKMEKTSSNTISPSFSLASLVEFVLFEGILKRVIGIRKFYSSSQGFFQSQLESIFGKSKCGLERKVSSSEGLRQRSSVSENENAEDGIKISREDVQMVLEKLRIGWNQDDNMLPENMGSDELSEVFEEEEPSFQEVKGAFDVFDENGDGYVDAMELQRVLCSMGFEQGSVVSECEKMIRVFDENKDGLIDFNEFVKLMESSFC